MHSKWDKFLKELANLSFFWFFGVMFFFVFRISFISIYHKQLSESATASEFAKAFLMGFRFDCTAVAYFLLIPFLLLLSLSYFDLFKTIRITRIIHQYLFVILSTIICIVTLNFFGEYHSQFNNFLFFRITIVYHFYTFQAGQLFGGKIKAN